MLIASWTLNVAFGVALFLKSKYPQGGYRSDGSIAEQIPFQKERNKRFGGPEFQKEFAPLRKERSRLMLELAESIASNELDSLRIGEISDSLDVLNGKIQDFQIHRMMRMHENLPPNSRRQIVPRMLKRMHKGDNMDFGHESQKKERRKRKQDF